MSFQHQNLSSGRWQKFSFSEQMANIGSEVGRAISWRRKKSSDYSGKAFARALELIDLTLMDKKNRSRLKEICRLREVLVDDFFGVNLYGSRDELWEKYFYAFNYATALEKGR